MAAAAAAAWIFPSSSSNVHRPLLFVTICCYSIAAFCLCNVARAQQQVQYSSGSEGGGGVGGSSSSRATHGLAYQSPMSFSPAAVEFFHPCNTGCAPSTEEEGRATLAQQQRQRQTSELNAEEGGRGGMAMVGVAFGVGLGLLLLALALAFAIGGVYYYRYVVASKPRSSCSTMSDSP